MTKKPKRAPVENSPLMDLLRPGALMIPAFTRLPGPSGSAIGVRAGLLLSQAWYMAKYHGGGWEYSPSDWAERTGLSDDQVSRALQTLVRAGYLERWQKNRVRLMTYKVAADVLERSLLSLASITAESRLCKTAESRLCKTAESRLCITAESRLSLDKKVTSKEVCGRSRPHKVEIVQGRNRAPIANDLAESPKPSALGCTLSEWLAYAQELSTIWGGSMDAKACWDEMVSVGWRDGARRLVRDWKAKARRYFGTWQAKGGAAKERKSPRTPKAPKLSAKEGAEMFGALRVAAGAGDWEEFRRLECAWRVADPAQFEFYLSEKKPPEWAARMAAAAARTA